MEIKITIQNPQVKIRLIGGRKILGRLSFKEEKNISEKLLAGIDKILRQKKLKPVDIKEITLDTDLGESFTTYRIAKTVEQVFNWAVNA